MQTVLFPGHTDGENMPCSDERQPLLSKITDCNILGSFIFAAPSQTCLPSAVLIPKLHRYLLSWWKYLLTMGPFP